MVSSLAGMSSFLNGNFWLDSLMRPVLRVLLLVLSFRMNTERW